MLWFFGFAQGTKRDVPHHVTIMSLSCLYAVELFPVERADLEKCLDLAL